MPLDYSGGYVIDRIKLLESEGHSVDVLTRYDKPFMRANVISVYHTPFKKIGIKYLYKFLSSVDVFNIGKKLKKTFKRNNTRKNINGIIICNPNEDIPPVKINDILCKITKEYDLVITSFMENMLTIPSLLAIYEKLKCPIIIGAVDQAPFTGGCWFSLNCERYKDECGRCPGLDSTDRNDQSHKNYLIKKDAYSKMNYMLLTNSWMMRYAKSSKLFDERRLALSYILIDEDKFVPMHRKKCKRMFGYNNEDIIFLSRYHTVINKGLNVYIKALSLLYQSLDDDIKKRIVVTFVGTNDISISKEIEFRTKFIPGLKISKLIQLYNATSFFVSPSISDAGPSMVNQSIMCGTPVCCFNIGTAIDVIKNGENGFKSDKIDADSLMKCLYKAVYLSDEAYKTMRTNSRKIALKYQSKKAYLNTIKNAYSKVCKLNNP